MKPEDNLKKLLETEKTLEAVETRFEAVTALTTEGIVIIDSNQKITFFNNSAEKIFGYKKREALGKPLDILLPERSIEKHSRLINDFALQSEGSRLMGDGNRRIFGRHKNGFDFPVEVSISKWTNKSELFFTAIVKNISDRLQNEEMIHRLAYYDTLSGLPSRIHFMEKLHQLIRESKSNNVPIAILLLDLVRFNEINNALGSSYGDLLIKNVAKRILEILEENDFAARIGSEEFGIIRSLRSDQANNLAATIGEAMRKPFKIENFPLVVEASIGIARFPEDGITAEGLVQKGEIAMLEAKKMGSDFTFYDAKKDPFINSNRLTLLGELFNALESGQFYLLYQPIIDLHTAEITGIESLIRWKHPTRGIILPSEFISPAENTDLIKAITLFVINESLKQFQTLFNLGKNLKIAVNISTRNLHDPILPGQIVKMLIASKISASSLELEITENAIMEHSETVLNAIQLIQRSGINLTIDEFGIGYSSLNILKRLPITTVKIPRSFIKDLSVNKEDLKIVQSIINLAHTLDLKATVVGVEDKMTLRKLIDIGCDSAQGNFMSPPITIKDVFGMMYKPVQNWV